MFIFCLSRNHFFTIFKIKRKKRKKQMQTSSAIPCKCDNTATPVCGFSQDTLVTLLEKARVDGVTRRDTDAYGDYFKSLPCSTNGDVMEHCKECSKTIAKHAPSNTVDKIAADEDMPFHCSHAYSFLFFRWLVATPKIRKPSSCSQSSPSSPCCFYQKTFSGTHYRMPPNSHVLSPQAPFCGFFDRHVKTE